MTSQLTLFEGLFNQAEDKKGPKLKMYLLVSETDHIYDFWIPFAN